MFSSPLSNFSTSLLLSKLTPMDGNTAAAYVGYGLSDSSFIYPITPSSPMGEVADKWSAEGVENAFGNVVAISELQSEGGASGALHGALSAGNLAATFTASQGLLLMIPNIYKIAGELLPGVLHIAARAVAGQALSIFGDHSDVMACRQTGACLLASGSVQEAMDLATIAHLSSVDASLPFIHFFDGFRTSHEINSIEQIDYAVLAEMINKDAIKAFRSKALNPEHPYLKGTSQGPDIYMQQVERANPYFEKTPAIVEQKMKLFEEKVGRKYNLFDYYGAEDATDVVVVMGSGSETIKHAVKYINEKENKKVGVVVVRLYRPFCEDKFLAALPKTTKRISVLDRTKEPGSLGEPLKLDVICATRKVKSIEKIIGGRYGLGSKEFDPGHAYSVFTNLAKEDSKDGFTVGIIDDLSHTSLPFVSKEKNIEIETEVKKNFGENLKECIFWGMGSDGTVGSNKDGVKIIVNNTDLHAQAYFSYSAHKSGGLTQSYLRFGDKKIDAPWLPKTADYTACHAPSYIYKYQLLDNLQNGGIFVLNHHANSIETLEQALPNSMKKKLVEKNVQFYVIDASKIASEVGLPGRINMIMQAVFFKLSGVIPEKESIQLLKDTIKKTYKKKGDKVIKANINAVDTALNYLVKYDVPKEWANCKIDPNDITEPTSPFYFFSENEFSTKKEEIPDFVKDIQFEINQLKGDLIPVSAFPAGGTVPNGTTKYEKRLTSEFVPEWNVDKCIQCNLCSASCPHGVVRPFLFEKGMKVPEGFISKKAAGKLGKDNLQFRIQVSPWNCTGCGVCVETCPSKGALFMADGNKQREEQALNWDFAAEKLAISTEKLFKEKAQKYKEKENIKNSQFRNPLFEFHGACAGCGETQIVKLITQFYGEQMIIQNATGCSSIWGGTHPWNPYSTSEKGYGPAWANSLFEDNAENGLGLALGYETRRNHLKQLINEAMKDMSSELKSKFEQLLNNFDDRQKSFDTSEEIKPILEKVKDSKPIFTELWESRDLFAKKSIWIIGGDGWAFDIGYGGLDHVLASGIDLNVLVLDTEVYSNTGGQCSKATTRGSVAKFAEAGKETQKKDLPLMTIPYGDVYVATTCMAADPKQALKAVKEAEAHKGVSMIINYSNCIAHGFNVNPVTYGKLAVSSGYAPLMRFNPNLKKKKMVIDSKKPKTKDFDKFIQCQARFTGLKKTYPEHYERKQKLLAEDVTRRYDLYKQYEKMYE